MSTGPDVITQRLQKAFGQEEPDYSILPESFGETGQQSQGYSILPGAPEEEKGDFRKGFSRGIEQTKATVVGGVGAVGQALGFDEFAQNRYNDYQEIMDNISASDMPTIARVEDIESVEDFVDWAAGVTGEQIPFIAGALMSSGAGGVAGFIAQTAARKGLQNITSDVVKKAAQKAISKSIQKSSLAGGFAYTSLAGTGEVAGEAVEAGLEVDPYLAVGSGAIIGALEQLPILTVMRQFNLMGGFTSEVMGRIASLPRAKKGLVMAGIVSGQEAGTEALQAVVEDAARSIIDKNYDFLGPEGESRIINGLAAGAVGGGIFGGAGGVLATPTARKENETSLTEVGKTIESLAAPATTPSIPQTTLGGAPPVDFSALGESQPKALPDMREPQTLIETFGLPVVSTETEVKDDVDGILDMTNDQIQAVKDVGLTPKSAFGRIEYREGPEGDLILIGERSEAPDPLQGLRTHIEDAASFTPADMALKFSLQVENQAERDKAVRAIRAIGSQLTRQQIEEGEARAKALQVIRQARGRGKSRSRLKASERGFEIGRKNRVTTAVRETLPTGQESTVAVPVSDVPPPPTLEAEVTSPEGGVTPQEQARIDRLMEKEALEGLSPREYGTLEKLLSKSEESNAEAVANDNQSLEQLFQDEDGNWLRQAVDEALDPNYLVPVEASRRMNVGFTAFNEAAKKMPLLGGRVGEEGALIGVIYSPKLGTVKVQPYGQYASGEQIEGDGVRIPYNELPQYLTGLGIDPGVAQNLGGTVLQKQGEIAAGMVSRRARNVVFINGDRIRTKQGLQKTLLHEMVVHSGLGALFNRTELTQVLNQMARIFNFDYVAQAYRIDIGDFAQTRSMENLTAVQAQNVRSSVEEGFARLAEENPRTSSFDKITIWIRQMIRRIFPGLKLSQDEMRYIVEQTAIALREPIFGKNRYRGMVAPYVSRLSTETKEFKRKFQGSKAVDQRGQPQVFYRGTKDGGQMLSNETLGVISFSPNPKVASDYATQLGARPENAFVYPVYLNVKNPMDFQNPAHRKRLGAALKRKALREGANYSDLRAEFDEQQMERGEYAILENPTALKDAGFDSVWTFEDGGRNLHLLDEKGIIFALENKPGTSRMSHAAQVIHTTAQGPAKMVSDVMLRMDVMSDAFGKDNSEEGTRAVADITNLQGIWSARSMKLFLTPQQISKKVKLAPIKRYMDAVERWWNTRIATIQHGSELVELWRNIGKGEADKLSKALFEISLKSDELGRRLSDAELQVQLGKSGMEADTIALYRRIDASMSKMLDDLQLGLESNAVWELADENPDSILKAYLAAREQGGAAVQKFYDSLTNGNAISVQINRIAQDFNDMRHRNYFPRSRFGRYHITGIAREDTEVEGRAVKKGKVGFFATFESVKENGIGFEKFSKQYPGLEWKRGKLADQEFAFLGLPPSLMESLNNKLKLKPAQKEALKEIFISLGPARGFVQHLTKRKGIAGYSEDAMRTYASYMLNAAGHLARVKHHVELTKPLQDMESLAQLKDPETGAHLPVPGGNGIVLGEFRDYFQQHYDYIMNPGNDLAQVRALGFLWYLGANPRSAAVNLTQVPMVTYPWLADRFGDAKSVGAITKAYKDVVATFRDLNKGALEPELVEAISQGMKDGFLDESLAVNIAEIADGATIARIAPTNAATRQLNNVSYYGTWMFHKAEIFNRRVAFTAAYRLARNQGHSKEGAYATAKDAVQSSQFEYAKWNRAAFMRGKKSVFFLFWNYVQQASFLAFGGEGKGTAARFWMMLLLAAGLQGLPFGDDLMELYDFAMTKMKKFAGVADPRTAIREDLRQMAQDLGANPDIVMHGLGRHYGLGPMHLLTAFGVPVSNTDISQSLGLGRVLPGFEDLVGKEKDPDKRLARLAVEAGGPVVGMGYNFWRLAFEESPDTWKKWERTLPAVARNLSRAMRFYSRGGETTSKGGSVVSWENRPERFSVWAAQAAGFGPTELSQAYEKRFAQREAMMFYKARREALLDDLGWASAIKDQEGVADARKAIRRYNKEVNNRQLSISNDEIKQSVRQRRKLLTLQELGQPNEKRFRQIYHEAGRGYE